MEQGQTNISNEILAVMKKLTGIQEKLKEIDSRLDIIDRDINSQQLKMEELRDDTMAISAYSRMLGRLGGYPTPPPKSGFEMASMSTYTDKLRPIPYHKLIR